MICTDFLAGANLDNEDPTVLLQSMSRFFKFLPGEQRRLFCTNDREGLVNRLRPKRPRLRLDPALYDQLRQQVLRRDRWRCQCCGSRQDLQVHHKQLRSQLVNMRSVILERSMSLIDDPKIYTESSSAESASLLQSHNIFGARSVPADVLSTLERLKG